MTKDPETNEFMMIVYFADKGDLRSDLSNNFNNILWKDKIDWLMLISGHLKNFHSGNNLIILNIKQ